MSHFPRWKIFLIIMVCLLGMILAMPNFLSEKQLKLVPNWWPKQTINLGLDLRGGSHLLLAIDFPYYLQEQIENLKDNIRKELRKEKIGYVNLRVNQDKVLFNLRDLAQAENAMALLRKNTDLNAKHEKDNFVISYNEAFQLNMRSKLIDQSIEIIRRRVDETGTKEPIIQRQGEDKILLQVPGLSDPEHLKNILGKTAKMTFHLVNDTVSPDGRIPFDSEVMEMDTAEGKTHKIVIYKKVMLNGDLLSDARASFNQYSKPVVVFSFNSLGAKQFAEITTKAVGKLLAIILDNKVITAPIINHPIVGGNGEISGNFTAQSANDLALLLRAGALPAPLKIIEERTVGPSLGAVSIAQGKFAALVSVVAVVVFMIVVYGVFGVFANIALCFNLIFLVSILSLLQATLTLPGIAGIVLTMGMSVDANVLIFERIREESKNGLSAFAALERGFNQAFNTILDSNLTTILVGIFLYIFGSGAIKGFAVTLVIGIATSMFSAITLTRLMMSKWVHVLRPKTLI